MPDRCGLSVRAGATLRTTMHTKMLAFLGSFVVLTVKFLLYKKWQRKYGPLHSALF